MNLKIPKHSNAAYSSNQDSSTLECSAKVSSLLEIHQITHYTKSIPKMFKLVLLIWDWTRKRQIHLFQVNLRLKSKDGTCDHKAAILIMYNLVSTTGKILMPFSIHNLFAAFRMLLHSILNNVHVLRNA